jgi:hypothetical protein
MNFSGLSDCIGMSPPPPDNHFISFHCPFRNFPGLRTLLSPPSVPAKLIGQIKGVSPGSLWLFLGKHAGQQFNFATNIPVY